MPEVPIAIEVDASGAIAGIKQAETAISQGLGRIQDSGITASRGIDVMEKSLGRLASSRAPNLLGQVNQQLLSQIPLLRDNASAFTLISTAAFAAQRALVAFLGPLGLIGLAAAALLLFANRAKEAKTEIEKLAEANDKLLSSFAKLAAAGIINADAVKKLRDDYAEAQTSLQILEQGLGTVEKMFGENSKEAITHRKAITGLSLEVNRMGESLQSIDWASTLEEQKGLAAFQEQLTGKWKEWNEALKKTPPILSDIQDSFDAFAEATDASWMLSTSDENPAVQKSREFDDAMRGWRLRIEETNEALKQTVEEEKKIAQKAEETKQTFLSLTYPIRQAFADLFLGIETDWGEMLRRMAVDLITSTIFKWIGTALTGPGGLLAGVFQQGTTFVPQTGLAIVHRGEAIIPAERNIFNRTVTNQTFGATVINNYFSTPIDSKMLRRTFLPLLKQAVNRREFGI